MNIERMYVYPPFKRMIKEKAASSGKSVIEWTKEFMDTPDPLDSLISKGKKNERKAFLDFP